MIAPRTDVSPEFLAQQGLSDNFPQRFWAKVFITPTHWLWEGARRPRGVIRNTFGHGTISRGIDKRVIQPHVASWLLHFGAIPEGKWVLHCCPGKHIPFCVNPEHLYLGDAKDNAADRMAQGTSPFFKGHTHVRRGEDNI